MELGSLKLVLLAGQAAGPAVKFTILSSPIHAGLDRSM